MKDQQKSKTQLISEIQDLRNQNLKLKNAQDFSDNLLETANAIVVTLDTEAHITIFNQYAQELTGYNADEVVGKNWFNLFIPVKDRSSIPKVFKDALKQMPDASQHENPILTKSGEERLISWNNNVLRNTSGKIYGILSIGMDITESKVIENELRESKEKFSETANLLPQVVYEADVSGNLTFVNKQAFESFGYSQEDIEKGINVLQTLIPEDRNRAKTNIKNIINGKNEGNAEYTAVRKDGSTFQVLMYSSAITKNNKPVGIRGIAVDITQRKQVESALRESEEWFSTITEQSVEGITVATNEGNFVFVNPAFCEMMGYTKEELLTMTVFDMKKIKGEEARKGFKKSKSSRGGAKVEVELQRKDKSNFVAEVTGKPIKIGDKNLVLGIVTDVTDRKQAVETLRKSEEQLRLITENTTDNIGITTFDMKATYLYVNPSVKSVLGYDPEDLIGKSFFDFIHPDDKKSLFPVLKTYVQQKIKKLLSGNEAKISEMIEFRFKNKAGNWRYMQSTVNIIGKQLLAVTRDITDRKLADKHFAESEERFRSLFENSQAVMMLIDSEEGNIVDVNSAACAFYGWKKSEMLGKLMSEINTLSPDEIKEKMRIAAAKKINHFEFRHRLSDESIRDVEVYAGPVQIEGKSLLYSLIFDITERKKVEAALFKSENKYRTLFEKSADAILIIRNQKFIDCNQATVKLLGYKNKKTLLDTHPSELSPEKQPDGQNSFEKADEMMAIAFKNSSHRFEWDHKKQNGEIFPVEVLLTAIPSDSGDFLHVVWRDITERKQSEKKLFENENKMRSIVEGTPSLFFYTQDTKGKLTYISPAVEKLTGHKVKDWLNRGDWFITDNKINKFAKQATWDHLGGNVTEGSIFIEVEHADKRPILLEIYENPVFDEGKVIGLQGVAHDVTQRFRAEEENKKLEIQLRRSQKMETIGTLAGGIAHDFNNILAPIMGFTELAMLKLDDTAPIANDLKQVLKGVHRAKGLVELLKFIKISTLLAQM